MPVNSLLLHKIEVRKNERAQRKRVKELIKNQKVVAQTTQITLEQSVGKKVKAHGRLRVRQCGHSEVDRFLKNYHYLPQHRLVGRQINHKVVDETGMTIAVIVWSNTPAMAVKTREIFMGWDGEKWWDFRKKYLNRIVADNARYCVHPHITNRANLASHILRISRERCLRDWKRRFGDDILFWETFVDLDYYSGTCYKADNWRKVGVTKGSSWYGTRVTKKDKGMGDRWGILGKRKGLTSGAVSKKAIFMRLVFSKERTKRVMAALLKQFNEKRRNNND